MTIAITGATGQLGRLVIAKLKAKLPASEIVALVRDPAKAADLGVTARAADYTKPAQLAEALKGVDKLLLISSSEVGQRATQHQNVIDAAKQAGVKLIAYTSILHADSTPLGLAVEHRATEAALKAAGIPYVLLRNGWYTENYTAAIAGAVPNGGIVGAAGDGKISAASRADYAEAAVAVLTGNGHENKIYELAGDTAFTMADLAAEVSKQTGKSIAYSNMPEAAYADLLKSFGLPDAFASLLAESDTGTSKGGLFNDSRTLSKLIGRPTTPLSTVVATVLKG